jgi:hypothetical protein
VDEPRAARPAPVPRAADPTAGPHLHHPTTKTVLLRSSSSLRRR